MKRLLPTLLFLIVFTFSTVGLASPLSFDTKGFPVPDDLNVTVPDTSINQDISSFSGIWSGKTNTQMGLLVVVERIEKGFGPTKIYTLVSWDERYVKPGWSRQLAHYDPDSKTLWMDVPGFSVPNFRIELKQPSNNVISGKYSGNLLTPNSLVLYKK